MTEQEETSPVPLTNNEDMEELPSNADPLASANSSAETIATEEDNDESVPVESFEAEGALASTTKKDITEYTDEELIKVLSERNTQVDLDDENMDPIEWTFRKLVPLPAVYFWDLLEGQPEEVKREYLQTKIPRKIRAWHRVIGSLDRAQHWMTDWVAKPLAGGLGITESRFSYVIDNMSEAELNESKRMVAERKLRQSQKAKQESAWMADQPYDIPIHVIDFSWFLRFYKIWYQMHTKYISYTQQSQCILFSFFHITIPYCFHNSWIKIMFS